jgi:hypothetical protein
MTSNRKAKSPKSVLLPLTLLFAALAAGRLTAQDYRFQVEQLDLQVYVQPDASARLEYTIAFANQPGAHAIDIVDVGLPHRNYSIANMSASVDDRVLGTMQRSEYINIGVEVHLGGHAIQPGQKGTFQFRCTMPDMVYQDTTDAERASLQIKPTWFDPALQVGNTELRIAVHLPPGVKPEEVTYHQESTRYTDLVLFGEGPEKHVVAIWQFPDRRLSDANPKVGVSFPRREMTRVVHMTAIGLFLKWWDEHTELQIYSGVLLAVSLGFLFLRFSHGTGFVVGLMLVGGLIFLMYISPALHLLCWPLVVSLIAVNEWYLSRRRRTATYLPAMATVEGGGIKRGLTAPQAAVLLGLPLGKVVALVIFGLLKKGVLRTVTENPLVVEVVEPFRITRKERIKVAAKQGIVVHDYEHPFIERLLKWDKPVEQCNLSEALGKLVKSTAGRMKGFDLSDTKEYYERIVARAWKEAESIGEIEQRTQVVDRHIEWMMMDPTWNRRFDHWGTRGYHYRPVWTHSGGAPSTGTSAAPQPSTSRTSFGEVASSFAGWAETTTGRLASAIDPVKMGIDIPRGVVDLSGVDKITANVFEALASSSGGSGGGGGGGGGCACACAGCACACACAGGGR